MDNMELLAIQEEDQNSLEHYGVKGQKWGQRNYQNPDGTYTELGKERRRVAFIKEEKAKKESDANAHQNGVEESIDTDVKISGKAYKDMTRKELRQAKKRARHNEALRRERREFNKEKKAALESGDIAFISQNISKFTNDELDQAMVRYNKMQNLKTMENANKKDSGYYADKAIEWLNRGAKASSAIANISNSFNDMAKKSAERRKTQIEADKAEEELDYLRDPQSRPLSRKEELALEKDKLELDWLKDPKSKPKTDKEELDYEKAKQEWEWTKNPKTKPMTEKEELDLKWLKDPSSKPKTRKEEIELEKAEQDLKWFYNPKDKPLTKSEELKNLEQELKNKKSKLENKQTDIETKWKKFMDEEKHKDYNDSSMSIKDFKQKWGSYDSSGKGKGGDGGGDKGPSKDEFIKMIISTNPDMNKSDAEKLYKDYNDHKFTGQRNSSIGGWFSKRDKDETNRDYNRDFDFDSKELNRLNEKYLAQLKSGNDAYWKNFSNNSSWFGSTRDDQWKKDLQKHDSDVIDKWVKDMKKKYMKERNMDAKTAEEKAEAYVDSWLDAYDDGIIKELQSMR